MRIIESIVEMQQLAESIRREGRTIGFVPTMGFLHEGHLSLMKKARTECNVVAVSIFVNPTQFGPNEDYDRYPRDSEGDKKKCESVGVDVLFTPATSEMYSKTGMTTVNVENISDILEGQIRPDHFRGVATVVSKLFNIVKPHKAYFGQKDYQQCAVIRRMVEGLNMDVSIGALPTIREKDGLAMSSRNAYLSPEQRRAASCLFRALSAGQKMITSGERQTEKIKQGMRDVILSEKEATIDYVEIADPETLTPAPKLIHTGIVLLVAVRLGSTRLIDNLIVPVN